MDLWALEGQSVQPCTSKSCTAGQTTVLRKLELSYSNLRHRDFRSHSNIVKERKQKWLKSRKKPWYLGWGCPVEIKK